MMSFCSDGPDGVCVPDNQIAVWAHSYPTLAWIKVEDLGSIGACHSDKHVLIHFTSDLSKGKTDNWESNTVFALIVHIWEEVTNESLLHIFMLQMHHYCVDSFSKRITSAHIHAPNESLLCRLMLQTNHYCRDSCSKRITTALQTNHYCRDSRSKWITTAQTCAPN